MQPQNAILGDDTGVALPQMEIEQEALTDELKMAKYSKTAEFKRIEAWCEERIAFYQSFLPNGLEVGLEVQPTAEDWRVANRVIGELKALMNAYEIAKTAVKDVHGK